MGKVGRKLYELWSAVYLADSFYEDGLSDLLRTLTPLGGAGLIADFQATYALNYQCDILYAHSVQSYCQGFYEYFHH